MRSKTIPFTGSSERLHAAAEDDEAQRGWGAARGHTASRGAGLQSPGHPLQTSSQFLLVTPGWRTASDPLHALSPSHHGLRASELLRPRLTAARSYCRGPGPREARGRAAAVSTAGLAGAARPESHGPGTQWGHSQSESQGASPEEVAWTPGAKQQDGHARPVPEEVTRVRFPDRVSSPTGRPLLTRPVGQARAGRSTDITSLYPQCHSVRWAPPGPPS